MKTSVRGVPLTRNSEKWTEAKFNSFIRSNIRQMQSKWGPLQEALRDAQVGRQINRLTGRMAMHYRCAHCSGHFPRKQVAVDHIIPIIDPAVGFVNWDAFIYRMLVEKAGFQVLCSNYDGSCHYLKTSEEREIANERRRKEKMNG